MPPSPLFVGITSAGSLSPSSRSRPYIICQRSISLLDKRERKTEDH
jgi:hypothetical protein